MTTDIWLIIALSYYFAQTRQRRLNAILKGIDDMFGWNDQKAVLDTVLSVVILRSSKFDALIFESTLLNAVDVSKFLCCYQPKPEESELYSPNSYRIDEQFRQPFL